MYRQHDLLSKLSQQWICPITQQPMTQPMLVDDGYTYNKHQIKQWLYRKSTSPITRKIIYSLTPNYALKNVIQKANEQIPKFTQQFQQNSNQLQLAQDILFQFYKLFLSETKVSQLVNLKCHQYQSILKYQQIILNHPKYKIIFQQIKQQKYWQNKQKQLIKLKIINFLLITFLLGFFIYLMVQILPIYELISAILAFLIKIIQTVYLCIYSIQSFLLTQIIWLIKSLFQLLSLLICFLLDLVQSFIITTFQAFFYIFIFIGKFLINGLMIVVPTILKYLIQLFKWIQEQTNFTNMKQFSMEIILLIADQIYY